jgi:hypothetical protein
MESSAYQSDSIKVRPLCGNLPRSVRLAVKMAVRRFRLPGGSFGLARSAPTPLARAGNRSPDITTGDGESAGAIHVDSPTDAVFPPEGGFALAGGRRPETDGANELVCMANERSGQRPSLNRAFLNTSQSS